MKVQREKVFIPVTLVLESQKELDYLYGISNSSMSTFKSQFEGLDMTLDGDYDEIQDNLFHKIQSLYQYQ